MLSSPKESSRQKLIHKIHDHLRDRKLVWVGTRGHDASGLMDFTQFTESYAITAPLGSVSLAVDLALEEISGTRVDLDTYQLDDDQSEAALEFRRRLLSSLSEPAVVVAYRPFALLSILCYPRADFVNYLGMFHERQATFEHKPWVESELRKNGVPVIPWRYFANEDRLQLEEYVASERSVVVRTNRSDGGAGLSVIRDRRETASNMPLAKDGFFAAAPYLEPSIPLNISGCIFKDGNISLHPPSIQLIGIEDLTCRRFGYCGNDFSAIKALSRLEIENLERLTLQAGHWLSSHGYLGAFGLDALIYKDSLFLTEINPRFQGSTLLSSRIDRRLGRPDVVVCHLSAYLGHSSPSAIPLIDLVAQQEDWSQIIIHNNSNTSIRPFDISSYSQPFDLELLPAEGVTVSPNGVLCRALTRGDVTSDGSTLTQNIMAKLDRYLADARHSLSRSFVDVCTESKEG